MSEKLPVVRDPSLDASMSVRNEDIVAIQVAKAELMLQEEDLRIETLIDKHQKDTAENRKQLDEVLKIKASATLSSRLKSAVKVLRSLGVADADYSVSVSLGQQNNESTVTESWSLHSEKSTRISAAASCAPRKLAADERAILTRINKADDEVSKLKDQLVEVRQKLSQIGTLERRARANMATVILQQSAGGRALLEQLDRTPLLALTNEAK